MRKWIWKEKTKLVEECVPVGDYDLGNGWMESITGLTDRPAPPGWVWVNVEALSCPWADRATR
jgi:hypothetical protein